jgi:dethiobiotin synthetase
MSDLPGLFVVGTDTEVGKTFVAAAIARSLSERGRRVGVLKPVATGATRLGDRWHSEDAELLMEAIGGGVPRERVAPIVYEEPLAPSVAARRIGVPLDQAEVEQGVREALEWWRSRAEIMVVEGIGGLLCPLAEGTTVADLAVSLDYPLVIVARRGLGTLNHTLLTVEAARRRGLRIAGIILNGAHPPADPIAESTNAEELARRLDGITVLAELEHGVSPRALSAILGSLDWYSRADAPRECVGERTQCLPRTE